MGVDEKARLCLALPDGRQATGRRREGDEGILYNMSGRPNKRNAVSMPGCADAVESV